MLIVFCMLVLYPYRSLIDSCSVNSVVSVVVYVHRSCPFPLSSRTCFPSMNPVHVPMRSRCPMLISSTSMTSCSENSMRAEL